MRTHIPYFKAAALTVASILWQVGYALSIGDAAALRRIGYQWTRPGAPNWTGRDSAWALRYQVSRAAIRFEVRALLWTARKLGMPGA